MTKPRWTITLEDTDAAPGSTLAKIKRLPKVAWRSMGLKAVAVTEEKPEQPSNAEAKP
jgi:hypothetical protein